MANDVEQNINTFLWLQWGSSHLGWGEFQVVVQCAWYCRCVEHAGWLHEEQKPLEVSEEQAEKDGVDVVSGTNQLDLRAPDGKKRLPDVLDAYDVIELEKNMPNNKASLT